ncbi:PREDICTED: transmembrane 4 L6 family member 1-like [Galeopterus variegatus]|uniref:Transmembrane 4 L6 family member 1-like n=1 Tax=Galeopterus variegatus TaxID=482537 RepID=A0ABM0Q620_GALVR|nr:PREDICTED: transmembrane 4 L6 family member 1-like [Galeopterus variegatus]
MFLPAFVFIGLEQDDCCGCCGHKNCGESCAMLSSVLAALIGIAGSGYCVIVAALGLAEGPLCLDSLGQWNYTFASTEGQYVIVPYLATHSYPHVCSSNPIKLNRLPSPTAHPVFVPTCSAIV